MIELFKKRLSNACMFLVLYGVGALVTYLTISVIDVEYIKVDIFGVDTISLETFALIFPGFTICLALLVSSYLMLFVFIATKSGVQKLFNTYDGIGFLVSLLLSVYVIVGREVIIFRVSDWRLWAFNILGLLGISGMIVAFTTVFLDD